jgi:DNA-binding transcriptional ArsR family regulator
MGEGSRLGLRALDHSRAECRAAISLLLRLVNVSRPFLVHPDELVLDAIDLAPGLVTTVVSEQAAGLRSPRRTVGELLDTLRDQGLVRSVARLRELFGVVDPLS